jgi:seryl-tRNA synthetase
MIDLRDLRNHPDKYRTGAINKNYDATLVDQALGFDEQYRPLNAEKENLVAEQNKIGKQIGQIAGQLKKADAEKKAALQDQMKQLQARPNEIKTRVAEIDEQAAGLQSKRDNLLLEIPKPAGDWVPVGKTADDNKQIRIWNPANFDVSKSFEENRGFRPKSHVELGNALNMFDFERGTKISGSRSYLLTGAGMQLHQAILRYAFDYMTMENGFTGVNVPVLVRDQTMVGTGFFPHGKETAYSIGNPTSDGEFYLTGTGEVGLMGYRMGEVLDFDELPLCYTTVSTCFRREAGAAGKDTRGLYRIHQFDKVEQVVICKADPEISKQWHAKMIGFVETLLQRLELPYQLLQCCTGDLGPKNVDMIDVECWMPSRGDVEQDANGRITKGGEYGETHSASVLHDYQCRRLNVRYKDPETGKNNFAHALNNTVAASPRILIPIMEMYQNEDGSITIPEVLRPHMAGAERIG